MNGTFVAQDLILFFVFFELVLLPMYFMIGVWGGEQRQYASIKFFLYTLFGSALMLLGVPGPVLPDGRRELLDGVPGRSTPARIVHINAAVDLRRPVHRLRRQGADVPVPHLAARRPHPGAHGGLGDPGRHPAEARHLRLHPHRHPDPARRRPQLGALDRRAGRHRHHLRRAVLPGPDRHETAHRLLVGRPHGLRHARHRHASRASVSTPPCSAWWPTASSPACSSSSPDR